MWWLPVDYAAIDPWLQALGIIVAALVAAAGGVLVARRATSGSTATSDAATLWEAAETIRVEQRTEIASLRERVAVLESQNREQARQIHDLEAELARLRGVVGD